jgi:hypothetical protein
VDPVAGDAAAGVLGRGDRMAAAGATLAGGARRVALRAGWGVADRAQADRAGIGYREASPTGAEMVQVGLCYPLADRHAASALSHRYLLQFPFARHGPSV